MGTPAMNQNLPPCRTIEIIAFRGDRSRNFTAAVRSALNDQKKGHGVGPSRLECLLFIGHAGVSIDGGQTYFGFGPEVGRTPAWKLMRELGNGAAFPGRVNDDTVVFAAASSRGLTLLPMKIVLPEPIFQTFAQSLDGERWKSQYSYGFPNGDGDCNCVTWLERLGLPLLSGRLREWTNVLANRLSYTSWRFGKCL